MSALVQTTNLTQRFGDTTALHQLNLAIPAGAVYGFIGPNGAGKTTTMRILTTLLPPSEGDATVAGFSVRREPAKVRRVIGFMPDYFGTYADVNCYEYLDFFARSYGLVGRERHQALKHTMSFTKLDELAEKPIRGLSKGMKQRLCLGRAMIHRPSVLILDEPANGLDPRARIELREMIRHLASDGTTVLVSSHILTELAEMCDVVGIIERGELIYSGPVADIVRRAKTGTVIHVGVVQGQEQAAALISQDPSVENVAANNGYIEVSLKDGVKDYSFLPQRLVQAGFKLTLLKEEEVNLETAFMRLTKGMVQ